MGEPATNFDSARFRQTLGLFTTGVTIITTRGQDGEPVGVTANSFSSVSLDPPLVLWSLARNARSLEVFKAARHFAIHILSAGQEDLSNRFAARGEDKFAGLAVTDGLDGTPLLDGCSARMQCRTVHQYEGGDHVIFVGEVVDLANSDAPPLVFQAGKYSLAARKANAAPFVASAKGASPFQDDFLGYMLWRAYFQFAAEMRKTPGIGEFSDAEFLLLVTLAHNNWRRPEVLTGGMFVDHEADEMAAALARLADKGLVEVAGRESGEPLAGLTEAGMERALEALSAARETEARFLDKLGQWDGAALKNLLRGFIVGTDPGIPHPWERLENEPEGSTS